MSKMLSETSRQEGISLSGRHGISLSLSGGGYRAALFHLGALRRLDELGILWLLRSVSSVSGGSIVSAHLATKVEWPLHGPVSDWEERVAAPFRDFCKRNIRTKPILEGLLPWKTNRRVLAGEYEKFLTPLALKDLPPSPNFIFCSTDLTFGVNWTFERNQAGDYEVGYLPSAATGWKLGFAVAASSCFPPVFNPLSIGPATMDLAQGKYPPGRDRDRLLKGLRLSDGGVYDNLGLEPVWKDHEIVLSSDGGALFDFEADKNLIWQVERYVSIPENQALAIRKRWLIASFVSGAFGGTYWGIGGSTSSYEVSGGYSKPFATEVIAAIRTDLDAFSDAEAFVLENHGYLLADAAIRTHVAQFKPDPYPRLAIPHPEWMDEDKARKALAGSSKRKIFGGGGKSTLGLTMWLPRSFPHLLNNAERVHSPGRSHLLPGRATCRWQKTVLPFPEAVEHHLKSPITCFLALERKHIARCAAGDAKHTTSDSSELTRVTVVVQMDKLIFVSFRQACMILPD